MALRIPYRTSGDTFDLINTVHKEPIGLFKQWFVGAVNCPSVYEANAMALATSTKSGVPSVRYVLLKGLDERGFHFYTNYESRKAKEMLENPCVGLVFYWEPLKRQIRIEGVASKLPTEYNDKYFSSRPRQSRISATVSCQSQPIPNREFLDDKCAELEKLYKDIEDVPRPSNW
ncbi:unnamed protein product [Protopolystoma xenopodis]|uniref:Pyridoxine-5'-phosphate oxidase n=1 Tax=Protopolystoma xenopodis TaxID=117903 RepID=A0A448XHA2_9PLAT|nr:unnamed protein product [Protopolystoma xenopodis]